MDLAASFLYLLTPWPLFLCVLGTALGILVGAVPGLSGAMLIALTLPLTFKMAPLDAMALLVSMYTGSITGGLISAILLRIPGTPSNVVTTFDGHTMAVRGEAGRAIGVSTDAQASWWGAISLSMKRRKLSRKASWSAVKRVRSIMAVTCWTERFDLYKAFAW